MSLYFESKLTSYEDIDYRVRLYSDSYKGINALIIGGTAKTFYVKYDWTDYLEAGQPLEITGSSSIAEDTVSLFTYNSAQDRTEIIVNTVDYSSDFVSLKNDDSDGDSFVPVFNPKLIGLNTQWEGNNDLVLSTLMTSETIINYANVQENRTAVDTAFFDRFFENYLIASDNDLKVVIHRDGGSGYELEWVGSLVRDLIEWNDESSPREYTFKAIDGIDKLKNIDYPGDLTSLTSNKIIDVVKNILNILELKEYWGSSAGYIRESLEFKSNDVVSVTAGNSPLDYTYIPDSVIIERDSDTDAPKFMSAYKVLEGIMQMFSCKFIHAQGLYQFVQIRNYDTSGYSFRIYNKTNNIYNASAYSHINANSRVLTGGKFGYLYGLRKSKINTFSATRENIALDVTPTLLYLDSNSDTKKQDSRTKYISSNAPVYSYNIGKIQGDLTQGKKISVQYDIEYLIGLTFPPTSWSYNLEIIIDIVDLSDDKYFAGGVHNGTYIPPYWGDSSGTTIRNYKRYITKIGGVNKRATLTDTTVIIPYDMEECQITVTFNVISKGGRVVFAPFFLRKLKIFLPIDGDDRDELLTVENNNNNFTKELEIEPIIINEGGNYVTANTLSVNYNYNGGAENINPVRFWDGGFDLEATLSGMRVLESMSLQFNNLEKYMGKFVNNGYTPAQTMQYNNKVYFAASCEKDYHTDEIQGTWIEVINSKAGLSTGVVIGTKDGVVSAQYAQDSKNVIDETYTVGTLSNVILSGARTSIDIDSTFDIKIGDVLQIVNSENQIIKEIVSTQNLDFVSEAGSRSLTIEPSTFDLDITEGFSIITGFRKLHTSGVYRFDTLQHTAVATVPSLLSDMLDNEVRVVDSDIWLKSGEVIYKIAGVAIIS